MTARAFLLGGLMVAAACMDVAGPHATRRVSLSLQPVFDLRAASGAGDVDSFVIIISNPPYPTDTIVRRIAPGQDTIQLTVQTTVTSSGVDTIGIGFNGFNSGSRLLLYAGSATVEVIAGAPTQTTPIPASYVGPGARIKTLTLSPHTVSFQVGNTVQFSIVATDSSDSTMSPDSVPVVFITRNANVASIDGAGLAQAQANGQAWIVAQSVARGSVRDSAQVTVAPQAPPSIGLSRTAVAFADTIGSANPADQTIGVTNIGGSTLTGLAVGTVSYGSGGSGWLTATLDVTAAPATLTLHVAPAAAGLAVGHYTATVPVTAAGAGNSPQTVSVVLDVIPGPAIALSMNAATFGFTLGGATPADDSIAVTNAGTGTLTGLGIGTITYGAGGSGWLSASVTATTAPSNVVLHVTPGSLAVGTYTATVPVTSGVASNSPQNIGVTFNVLGVPAIGLSTTTLAFADTIGTAGPGNRTVTVTNTGTGTLSGLAVGTIVYGAGASGWLSASLNQAAAPATLTVQALTAGLTPGHYTATIPVTGTASNSPQNVAVSIDVTYPPLASVALSPGFQVLLPTGTGALTATGTSTIGTTVPTTITWSSRNTAVATVTAAGVVTAVAGGTAVIVADAGGGIADSMVVAVAGSGQAVVSAISDSRGFDRVKAGDTVRVVVAVDLRGVSGGNVGSYTAEVDWNAAQLTYVRADTLIGGFSGPTINQTNVGAGQLRFGAANPNGYTGPQIGLLSIVFVAGTSGSTPVTLLLTDLTSAGTFTNLLTQAIIVSSAVAVQ